MNKESALIHKIQMRVSELGGRVFRNNIGFCECRGRKIRYGICNPGGADLIGWNPFGRFLAIEVKIDSPTSKEQAAFLKAIILDGGIAFVAKSVDDVTYATLTGH